MMSQNSTKFKKIYTPITISLIHFPEHLNHSFDSVQLAP